MEHETTSEARGRILGRGAAALRRGDSAAAEAAAASILSGDPADAAAAELLAVARIEAGRRPEAIEGLERAADAGAGPRIRLLLGRQRGAAGDLDAGLADLAGAERAAAAASDEPVRIAAVAAAAELEERAGRTEAALARVRGELGKAGEPVAPAIAAVTMRLLAASGRADEALDIARGLLAGPEGADDDRAARREALLTAARIFERAGAVDEALDAAAGGHALVRHGFDPIGFGRFVQAIIAASPAPVDAPPARPPGDGLGAGCIFIVGAPRCGSTLLERMLDAHPSVTGLGEIPHLHRLAAELPRRIGATRPYPACLGELTPSAAEALGRDYLASTAPLRSGDPAVTHEVNKDLGVLLHVGLVGRILPGAVVVRVRRDPVDHAVAIHLERLRPSAAPYAADLRHLGQVLRLHDRLAAHWSAVAPGRFLEVAYEDLVTDPEPPLRRVLEAAGLDWDADCLAFHRTGRVDRTLSYDQARRPLSRASVGRAAAYGARLDPLRRALGRPPFGDESAPDPDVTRA